MSSDSTQFRRLATMKICYLISEWPGQSHVWAWREISHLRELGLEVEIFSTRRPQDLNRSHHAFASLPEAESVYLWPMSWQQMLFGLLWAMICHPRGLFACLQLSFRLPLEQRPAWRSVLPLILPACQFAQAIQRRKIQHIHSPMPANSAILCMMVKRLIGVPFSLTVVADFTHWGGAMQEKLSEASFVAMVSQWMLRRMQQKFPELSSLPRGLARHGVDVKKWKPLTSKPQTEPLQILSVGRLAESKGFDLLLNAIAQVKHRGVQFKLDIAGEGPERSKIEALIVQLNLQHEVQLLGSLGEEECLAQMQAADLFVLATHDEALGVVFLEAMAVETAVIGTAVGGVMEIIQDEVNGLLVSPNQVEALATAIERLLSDPELRLKLGKAGRQTILKQFDSRQGAAALMDLILASHQPEQAWITPVSEGI